MSEAREAIERIAEELQLTMNYRFVPWSLSQNAGQEKPSLNYLVTISRKGNSIITTDYMMGCGNCTSYKPGRKTVDEDAAIKRECETGRTKIGAVIGPQLANVIYCLCSDAEAIDHPNFESWANEMGENEDSRIAERTYQACLGIALRLRSGLGEEAFAALREACRDY